MGLLTTIFVTATLLYSVQCVPINLHYISCPANWTLSSMASTPMCYRNLPPIQRADLNRECAAINGSAINLASIDEAKEVIHMMRTYKYYGIWLNAAMDSNGAYKWIDGAAAPYPLQWCSGSNFTAANLVIVCPYPKYDKFSIDTCCMIDREALTKWATICRRQPNEFCQYTEGKELPKDRFSFIGSTPAVMSPEDVRGNEGCCAACARLSRCSAFVLDNDAKVCNFYESSEPFDDINRVAIKSMSNVMSGTPYSRLVS